MNDGIYILQNDKFLFANPRFSEITGYDSDELSKESFDFKRLFSKKGLKVLEKRDEMRNRGETPPSRYIFEGKRKDGQKRDFEASVTSVSWQEKPSILGVVNDVTERETARMNLEIALDQARQAEKVKSLFLANMSHEIRTPLNSILGFTDLIEMSSKGKIGIEEREFFDTIRQSGQRLMHTVHEILDLSQLEAEVEKSIPKLIQLNDIINKIVREFKPAAEKKGLGVFFKSNVKEAVIEADETQIEKSIVNLMDNAIKYTRKGKIDLALNQKSDQYIFKIHDTGIGISEEYLNQIYDSFSQESIGYTKKYQGLGLGLAITKRYMDMNDVSISVESKKGLGTTFTLKFKSFKKKHKNII